MSEGNQPASPVPYLSPSGHRPKGFGAIGKLRLTECLAVVVLDATGHMQKMPKPANCQEKADNFCKNFTNKFTLQTNMMARFKPPKKQRRKQKQLIVSSQVGALNLHLLDGGSKVLLQHGAIQGPQDGINVGCNGII